MIKFKASVIGAVTLVVVIYPIHIWNIEISTNDEW